MPALIQDMKYWVIIYIHYVDKRTLTEMMATTIKADAKTKRFYLASLANIMAFCEAVYCLLCLQLRLFLAFLI